MLQSKWKSLAATTALALAGIASASAAETTLTLAHVDPPEWTTSKKGAAALVFKQFVEAESGGRIEVQLFDSGSLGGEMDLVQSVQDGTLTMTIVSGPFSQICPAAAVLDLPYIFPSAPVAWKVLDGEFGDKLAEHCLEKTGLRTLAYGETGFRNFTNNSRVIAEPKDVEGLKLRVMTSPLFVEMVKSLGGEPTPISWPEVPTALATGVVDGQENPVSVIYANKFYELQKYMTLDQHVYGTDFLLINEGVYQGLSDADKALLRRNAIIAGTVGRAIQQVNTASGMSKLIDEGMQVYKPTDEQIAKFREVAQPAVKEWLATQIDKSWIEQLEAAVNQAAASL